MSFCFLAYNTSYTKYIEKVEVHWFCYYSFIFQIHPNVKLQKYKN